MESSPRSTITVQVGAGDIAKAWKFGKAFSSKRSRKSFLDFGHGRRARHGRDRLGDCVSGKLGEIAFGRVANEFGHEIEIDYRIRRGWLKIDDGQDVLRIDGGKPALRCDVKTSKSSAQWLLVESHKADKKVIRPDIFVFMKIDLPSDLEEQPQNLLGRSFRCTYAGHLFEADLFDSQGEAWFEFKGGQSLLAAEVADAVIQEAQREKGSDSQITKTDLTEAYKNLDPDFRKRRLRTKLKARRNFAMPLSRLRKDQSELEFLFRALKGEGDPSEQRGIFED